MSGVGIRSPIDRWVEYQGQMSKSDSFRKLSPESNVGVGSQFKIESQFRWRVLIQVSVLDKGLESGRRVSMSRLDQSLVVESLVGCRG